EEVKFDGKNVTSVDWMTYPILDITETPEAIDVVLINHSELAPTGSGEPAIRPVAAAIANAIFDATGGRIRRVPFSPDRVKQSLSCPRRAIGAVPTMPQRRRELLPSPLWGGSARSAGVGVPKLMRLHRLTCITPTPNPSPQGGGERTECPAR